MEEKESAWITYGIWFLFIFVLYIAGLLVYRAYQYDPEDHVFGNVYKVINITSDSVLLQTEGRYTSILSVKSCSPKKESYELGDQVVSHYKGLDKDGKKEYAMLHKKLCEKVNE